MGFRFIRKQRLGVDRMGHFSKAVRVNGGGDLVAAFGLRLAHASTIDGQVRTPTLLTTGDPLLVYTKDGAVEWAAHWTSVTNGNDAVLASLTDNVGRIANLVVLPDGGILCVGMVMASKNGSAQQTVEIRNGDGTIFKTFDTLAANPEDQCGIGTDGQAVNGFIARYDSQGNVLWVKRFGHNQAATTGTFFQTNMIGTLRVDAANNTCVYNSNWGGPTFPSFGTWTVGIGETPTHSEVPPTVGQFWTIETEFDLADGAYTGNYWVNRSATNLDTFPSIAGVAGVTDDSNPYLALMRHGDSRRAATVLNIDRDGASPIALTLPFAAAANLWSAIWSYADAGEDGPDWVATLQRANTGDLLAADNCRRPLLGASSHFLTARYDNTFAGATFSMDSVQTGLAFTEAGLPTSATGFNGVLWKLDNDGLSNPLMKAIHKTVGTDPCNFALSVLNEASSLVVGSVTIPPANTYRFDPGEASQTDIAAIGTTGADDIVVFLDDGNFDILSHIHNVGTQHRSDGSAPGYARGNWNEALGSEEMVASAQITDGTSIIDVHGANLAQAAPLGSEIMYFGYSLIDVRSRSLLAFSGKLFSIGTVNTAAGVLTEQTALNVRRV